MRKSLQLLAIATLLLTLGATTVLADDAAPSTRGVVNLNTADAAQLQFLPRVGEKAALRILEYRKQHGSFKKATDLMQVKGFGQKTFDLVAPYIAVDGKTTLTEKIRTPRKARAQKPTSTASN
ncbi:MAG TPA: helix-hairpin-helix domain-containing protein [Thermoanaerobaculia bacterium]